MRGILAIGDTTIIPEDFIELMRNRLTLGGMRYGIFGDPNKPKYDNLTGIRHRYRTFTERGDGEMLVDCANLAMCHFVEWKDRDKARLNPAGIFLPFSKDIDRKSVV